MGARVVFCTFGSLGDVYPYLALARELMRRGHAPAIATTPAYRKAVESEGVAFHPVRPDIDVCDPELLRRAMDLRNGGKYIFSQVLLPALRESYEDTAAAAQDADLLVTHPVTLAAYLFARKSGMPWVSTALAPMSFYSAYDPAVFPGLPLAETLATPGPAFQRGLLRTLAYLLEPMLKPFRVFEKELGLDPAPNPLFWAHSPHLALGLFSPQLAAPQPDWPACSVAAGFPFFEHAQENPPELERFLDSGEPPIVFTLGSAAVGVGADFFKQSAAAAHLLGRRAVLLCGRDPRNHPPRDLPPGVIAVPYAPHAAVFPRASVIVHQGGIGTTGEAMRAGRPMLVVPFSHDQPDHATRLARKGVARILRPSAYYSGAAARELDILLHDARYLVRAGAIAARMREENGAPAACDRLCRMCTRSPETVCA
jgi:rhamnosyltransferase subunit B